MLHPLQNFITVKKESRPKELCGTNKAFYNYGGVLCGYASEIDMQVLYVM
jgi:hypothetical protein